MPVPEQSFWRELWRRSEVLDRLTAGYVFAFALALSILGRGNPSWRLLVSAHVLILIAIVLIVWFWRDRTWQISGFIRQLYPVMLYSAFYAEMQVATHWIVPRFLDDKIVAFEHAVLGTNLNVWIMRAQSSWVNEIMMAGYFSYYLLIPTVALVYFFRRQIRDLRGMLLSTTTAFVMSYIGFVLYPVEGPRYFLADQFPGPLSGWFFVPLVRSLINQAAFHGGCMPSSHSAVALVVLFWTRRSMPRLGSIITPFVFVLILGTVWGRFHYASDAVVGIIVGLTALAVTGFWSKHESVDSYRGVDSHEAIRESRAVSRSVEQKG